MSCAWIAHWAATRRRGDDAPAKQAFEAMQTAHHWKILAEMRCQSDWTPMLLESPTR